jgi:hypothetical protein
MGGISGLGSEFNAFLIPSLLTAIASNRRMVYFRSKRKWEYDCPDKSGWACYLSFPCVESGVSMEELDYSQRYLINDQFSLRIDNMTSMQLHPPRNAATYKFINSFVHPDGKKCNVDDKSLSVTILTGMAARYLFQLNSGTHAAVRKINSRYRMRSHSSSRGYFALQLRLTDKKFEMSKEAWAWMNNVTNSVELMKPFFKEEKIKNLYVGKVI